jgi:hypothetical protein
MCLARLAAHAAQHAAVDQRSVSELQLLAVQVRWCGRRGCVRRRALAAV